MTLAKIPSLLHHWGLRFGRLFLFSMKVSNFGFFLKGPWLLDSLLRANLDCLTSFFKMGFVFPEIPSSLNWDWGGGGVGGDALARFLLSQTHCQEEAVPTWLGHILGSETHLYSDF